MLYGSGIAVSRIEFYVIRQGKDFLPYGIKQLAAAPRREIGTSHRL